MNYDKCLCLKPARDLNYSEQRNGAGGSSGSDCGIGHMSLTKLTAAVTVSAAQLLFACRVYILFA